MKKTPQWSSDRIIDQIRRGTWRPERQIYRRAPAVDRSDETIHTTLSLWWAQVRDELKPNTQDDYEWRLSLLLGFRPETPTAEIDARWVDELRAHLADLKARNRKRGQTLSPRSVNMALDVLAQALDLAIDHDVIGVNPARGKRRRAKVPKLDRTFLEPDMVRDLLDVAGSWEEGLPEHQRYGRRALLALLCLAGPRISEAIGADRGDFDLTLGRWRIPKSKTDAGRRDVELSAFLVNELNGHVVNMKSLGRPVGQRAPMFPTSTGARQNPSNVRNRLLAPAVERANESRGDDAMTLPNVTPHSLRRTFASLALAAGRDPRWVMAQIGHTDARFTLSVYGQIVQRQREDRELIWELMRFANNPTDPPGGRLIDPRNDPIEQTGGETANAAVAAA